MNIYFYQILRNFSRDLVEAVAISPGKTVSLSVLKQLRLMVFFLNNRSKINSQNRDGHHANSSQRKTKKKQ
jgi:hypothetical protein